MLATDRSAPTEAKPSMAQTSETIDLFFMATILSKVYVIILHPIVRLRHPLMGGELGIRNNDRGRIAGDAVAGKAAQKASRMSLSASLCEVSIGKIYLCLM